MRKRLRTVVGFVAILYVVLAVVPATAFISQSMATKAGLTRAWIAQVGSPQATGPIVYLHLDRGLLLALTQRGTLAAIDAESGRTLWSTQVGARDRQCSEPTANERYVVVVNGSMLHVLDRETGDLLWQKQLVGTPGAGPAISNKHVFVPMINGKLEAYMLDKGAKQRPWNYKSTGRLLIPPVITDHTVAWTTERGHMYVADPDELRTKYRLETRGSVQAKPAYWTPYLYAASSDGTLYAVNESAGKIAWKFMMGEASYESPVAINGRVYIVTQMGEMFCLDGETGKEVWHAPGLKQFIAAGASRLYVTDRVGRLVVLDAKSGLRLASMPLDGIAHKLTNSQTDRVYVADASGAVQCLREPQLKSPLAYTPPKSAKGQGMERARPRSADDDEPSETAREEAAAPAPATPPVREETRPTPPPATTPADDDDPFK